MNLQQMKFIVAIADNQLNISKASKVLYTSQPGVSRHLRLLEEELELKIFKRQGKQIVSITKRGEYVLAGLREVLNKVDEIKTLAKDLSFDKTKCFPKSIINFPKKELEAISIAK